MPFLDIILIWIVPLFQMIAFHGVMVSSWGMSMLVSVKKKAQSLWDLDNFRGIHVLSYFRQWYAACCIPELLRVASCKVSDLQQGFVKGRRMIVAFMALYALIEARRTRKRPLLVTFIDVKKAFPTVCREVLWQRLDMLGVDAAVIRSLILLYDGTTATIRASDGFGRPFMTSSGTREGGVESPLLYVLYVSALLTAVENADLEDGVPTLFGRRAPALMIADDLALIAFSEKDMQRLLDICQREYALLLSALNLDKTRTVPFEPADSRIYSIQTDGSCLTVVDPSAKLRRYGRQVDLKYNGRNVLFAKQYNYLGLIFASKSSPVCAWTARDSAALKAFGCFRVCMSGFFFLHFFRICQLLWSLVFCVYLYGAELWGPFGAPSAVQLRAYRWLFGFHRSKLSKMCFWFPLEDVEVLALAKALKFVCSAVGASGLLRDTVGQFIVNFTEAGTSGRGTWYGRLQLRVRKVWPGFTVSADRGGGRISIRGLPPEVVEASPKDIARHFVAASAAKAARLRYNELLANPPTIFQQDYVFHAIIKKCRSRNPDFCSTVFVAIPAGAQHLVQTLIRLLSGMGDFARMHAHHALRKKLVLPLRLRRTCLFCTLHRLNLHSGVDINQLSSPVDTEWHFLFECVTTAPARVAYQNALEEQFSQFSLPWAPSLDSLVVHTLHAIDFPGILQLFMKCISVSFSLRHKAMSRISPSALRSAFGVPSVV
jgi:hypothetical protein